MFSNRDRYTANNIRNSADGSARGLRPIPVFKNHYGSDSSFDVLVPSSQLLDRLNPKGEMEYQVDKSGAVIGSQVPDFPGH